MGQPINCKYESDVLPFQLINYLLFAWIRHRLKLKTQSGGSGLLMIYQYVKHRSA